MDHTEPPTPIDGCFRWVLTVRDLASGSTLAAHAVVAPDAASTVHLLAALFAQHGPPLVLKADNGAAFVAAETRAFLHQHRVLLLRSPPYTPAYNGACEAGNGTIKHLTHQIACRHDRPQRWTLDDLEAARLLANRRITGPHENRTPEQSFAVRDAIADAERDQLRDAYRVARQRRLRQLSIEPDSRARSISADALDRQAIADALSDTGVITIRSRRVRLSNRLQDAG
jgi:transposase InsO family protein